MNGEQVAARRYVAAVTTLAGLATAAIGVWALVGPRSFGDWAGFGFHEHFLHDIGAFQLGLGVTLLLAVLWSDALATALAGFLVANTAHTVNHVVDLDLGGAAWQAWALGAVSIAIAVALVLRLRQVGYVVGNVGSTTEPTLAPFVRQKTIRLTTFRKDGTPGSTPVSIAVDGDRAFVRSFEKSLKTRRLASDPRVEFGPCSGFGTPSGTAHTGQMRRLSGQEYRHAARMLRRKYPLLHGVVVPLAHRLGRAKTGRTVHFELVPTQAAERSDASV
ncbi:MAG: PPOX class F420-dependent oxidoreductase [Actinophytocola sp.]|nr:PPOX class F420-dependent oxidoreductase [Actinophytocola sp.]